MTLTQVNDSSALWSRPNNLIVFLMYSINKYNLLFQNFHWIRKFCIEIFQKIQIFLFLLINSDKFSVRFWTVRPAGQTGSFPSQFRWIFCINLPRVESNQKYVSPHILICWFLIFWLSPQVCRVRTSFCLNFKVWKIKKLKINLPYLC